MSNSLNKYPTLYNSDNMKIVLVPAYNEEKNIKEVITRLKKISYLKIIVVDDGSKDKTSIIVKKMKVDLIRHTTNKGKAEAINTGLNYILKNYPQAKYIGLIDADMQYIPEEINRIFYPLEKNEADVVTGYRNWSKVPFRHRLGNFVWRTAFNIFFGTHFKDTNIGYMALNTKATKIMRNKIHGGYILENSMFIEAIKHKLKIRQVPVTVLYKRQSEVKRGIRVVAQVLFFILTEGLKYRFGIK